MDWKQEMMKRLDALADKFGTTGAYLWHVLVKQGIAEGISNIATAVACGIAAFIAYKLATLFLAKANADDWDNPGLALGAIFSYIASGGLCIATLACINSAILELVNPEYFALHQVLQTLGK